jgi:hypothetical protein
MSLIRAGCGAETPAREAREEVGQGDQVRGHQAGVIPAAHSISSVPRNRVRSRVDEVIE